MANATQVIRIHLTLEFISSVEVFLLPFCDKCTRSLKKSLHLRPLTPNATAAVVCIRHKKVVYKREQDVVKLNTCLSLSSRASLT